MPKIIKIESARHMDGEYWEVGQNIGYQKIITEIKDCSMVFPDSIDYQYDIFVNNKPWKSLINMPVKVEYSLED